MGFAKCVLFWMKGAVGMKVFWCPTWITAGVMSASGVTYWAWRWIKVKAWPNWVLANKDQLGHRKGGGKGNMGKISLASPEGCLEDEREFARFLGPRIQDVEGMCGTWGGYWVEEERCGLPSHCPLAAGLSAAQLPGNIVSGIEMLNSFLKAFCPEVSEAIMISL